MVTTSPSSLSDRSSDEGSVLGYSQNTIRPHPIESVPSTALAPQISNNIDQLDLEDDYDDDDEVRQLSLSDTEGGDEVKQDRLERFKATRQRTITQVILLGCLQMLGPGLFNALRVSPFRTMVDAINNTYPVSYGVSGVYYISAATASYFGGALFNKLGPKPLLIAGVIGHALYEMSYYFLTHTQIVTWVNILSSLFLGGVSGIMGIGICGFLLAIPVKTEMGFNYALFHSIAAITPVILSVLYSSVNWHLFSPDFNDATAMVTGQAFPMDINHPNLTNVMSWTAIGSILIGGFLCVALISPIHKIKRKDGSIINFQRWMGVYFDLKENAYVSLDPLVCNLFVVYIYSDYAKNYLSSYLIMNFFNPRSQGIVRCMYYGFFIAGAFLCGWILDRDQWSARSRMISAWRILVISSLCLYITAMISQYVSCNGNVDKNRDDNMAMEHNMVYSVAWFPPQEELSGCEFLDHNAELQLLQCTHEGYYGWCEIDVPTMFTNKVCSRDTSFWDICIQVDINYLTQATAPILSIIFMAIHESFIVILMFWMTAAMAGPQNTMAVRYISVYFALRAIGSSIALFIDMFEFMLYRYQGIICCLLCFISIGAIYTAIGTIEQKIYRRHHIAKDKFAQMNYEYYYSYYNSCESV